MLTFLRFELKIILKMGVVCKHVFDAEVESVKSDEKVRIQYMLLLEAYARERYIGEYIRVVSQIRDAIGDFTTKQMAKYFKVKEKACKDAVECIAAHPDWNDEQIADQVDWEG